MERTQGECVFAFAYRKKTFTGLPMNIISYCSSPYNLGLNKTLIDRTFKINSSWIDLHVDNMNLTSTLQGNQLQSISQMVLSNESEEHVPNFGSVQLYREFTCLISHQKLMKSNCAKGRRNLGSSQGKRLCKD